MRAFNCYIGSRFQVNMVSRSLVKTAIACAIFLSMACMFLLNYRLWFHTIERRDNLLQVVIETSTMRSTRSDINKTHPLEFVPSDLMPDVIKDVKILVNPSNACNVDKEGAVFLLIMILSAVTNHKERQFIRESYGTIRLHNNHVIRHVFLLGVRHYDRFPKLSEELKKEGEEHGDIAQFDFTDTYQNLAIKTSSGLMWSYRYCPARYVLKTDDDVMVFTERVVNFLSKLNPMQEHKLYNGLANGGSAVVRDKNSIYVRYYVPYEIWPYVIYPHYNVGVGILMSKWVVKQFYLASKKIVRTPSEDVYLGILAKAIGIYPSCNKGMAIFHGSQLMLTVKDPKRIFCKHWTVMLALFYPTSSWEAWNAYRKYNAIGDKSVMAMCNTTEMYRDGVCPYFSDRPEIGVLVYNFR